MCRFLIIYRVSVGWLRVAAAGGADPPAGAVGFAVYVPAGFVAEDVVALAAGFEVGASKPAILYSHIKRLLS